MSRSKIRNKWIRKIFSDNAHSEEPKNKPSKRIVKYISRSKVKWLQEPGSFGGHKVHTNGHRMVSGIVRAKMKEELRDNIDEKQITDVSDY